MQEAINLDWVVNRIAVQGWIGAVDEALAKIGRLKELGI